MNAYWMKKMWNYTGEQYPQHQKLETAEILLYIFGSFSGKFGDFWLKKYSINIDDDCL